MAILEKEVWVTLISKTMIHYEEKGYYIPRHVDNQGRMAVKRGTKILVKIEDLPPNSNVKLTKVCDTVGCGKHIPNQQYNNILKCRDKFGKDKCYNCGKAAGGKTKKDSVVYESSLGYWALKNDKEYLLREFSDKNNISPNQVSYGSPTYYFWNCEKCNEEFKNNVNARTNLQAGCPRCGGSRLVVGFNDLWTVQPDIAKLLVNKEDGYKHTKSSNVKLDWECPDCNNVVKNKPIASVYNNGLSCPNCSDGISYPEKFMMKVLDQLNVDFEKEKTFTWADRKRYDFYISSINCIIEVNGGQHYRESFNSIGGRSSKEEQENDKLKEDLANSNGIMEYIVIDARRSEMKWLKNEIIKSDMSKIFNLKNIDWSICHEYACKSLVKLVCQIWNNSNMTTTQIGNKYNFTKNTIISYLKQGESLGWCEYNPKESSRKPIVQLTEDWLFVKEWESMTDASKTLNINRDSIRSSCKKTEKIYKGYRWMYKTDYNELIKRKEVN